MSFYIFSIPFKVVSFWLSEKRFQRSYIFKMVRIRHELNISFFQWNDICQKRLLLPTTRLDICFVFLGVMFKLDEENLHESLHLIRGNLTVKQSSMVHANVFGTAFLADGRHFWTVKIDSFKGENSFIAVG